VSPTHDGHMVRYGRDVRQGTAVALVAREGVAKCVTGTVRDDRDAVARMDRLAWDAAR